MYTGKKRKPNMLAIAVIILCLGVLFTSVSCGLTITRVMHSNRCKVVTMATVIENQPRYDRNDEINYYPVYQYFVDGREYVAVSNSGGYPASFEVGEQVELRYNWDNPGEYYVIAEPVFYVATAVFGFTGVALLIAFFTFTILRLKDFWV